MRMLLARKITSTSYSIHRLLHIWVEEEVNVWTSLLCRWTGRTDIVLDCICFKMELLTVNQIAYFLKRLHQHFPFRYKILLFRDIIWRSNNDFFQIARSSNLKWQTIFILNRKHFKFILFRFTFWTSGYCIYRTYTWKYI